MNLIIGQWVTGTEQWPTLFIHVCWTIWAMPSVSSAQ